MKINVPVDVEIFTSNKQSSMANIYLNSELLCMVTFNTSRVEDGVLYFIDHHNNNIVKFYEFNIIKVNDKPIKLNEKNIDNYCKNYMPIISGI